MGQFRHCLLVRFQSVPAVPGTTDGERCQVLTRVAQQRLCRGRITPGSFCGSREPRQTTSNPISV
jgi:hypothetical protein